MPLQRRSERLFINFQSGACHCTAFKCAGVHLISWTFLVIFTWAWEYDADFAFLLFLLCLWDRACKSQTSSISLCSLGWPWPPGMTGVHCTPNPGWRTCTPHLTIVCFCAEYLMMVPPLSPFMRHFIEVFCVLPSRMLLLMRLTCASPGSGERKEDSGQPSWKCSPTVDWRWWFPRCSG